MRCTEVPSAETQPGKWSNINPRESPLQLEIALQAQKNPRSSNSILSIVTEKKSALIVCETHRAAQNSK